MIRVVNNGTNFELVLVPGSQKGAVDVWARQEGEATASYLFVKAKPRGMNLGSEFFGKLASALNALSEVCWFSQVVAEVNNAIQQDYPGLVLEGVAEN